MSNVLNRERVLRLAIIIVEQVNNVVVVKTHPGMAQGVAASVELSGTTGLIGCVAGDDTIVFIMKNDEYASEAAKNLQTYATDSHFDFVQVMLESIVTVDAVRNLVHIKTHPGMAQGTAAAVEATDIKIIGCVAGDDSVILVGRDDNNALEISKSVKKLINQN